MLAARQTRLGLCAASRIHYLPADMRGTRAAAPPVCSAAARAPRMSAHEKKWKMCSLRRKRLFKHLPCRRVACRRIACQRMSPTCMSAHCMSAHCMSAHCMSARRMSAHRMLAHCMSARNAPTFKAKKTFLHSFRPGAEQTAASKRFHGQRRQSSGCLHCFWAPSCVHGTAYRPSPPRHALPSLRGQSATSRTNVSARACKQRRAGQMSAGTK